MKFSIYRGGFRKAGGPNMGALVNTTLKWWNAENQQHAYTVMCDDTGEIVVDFVNRSSWEPGK